MFNVVLCWLSVSRPSFYTHGNAPGVVMAAGNTGEYLDASTDTTCTWMSRDGGANWEDVADYAAIYEFGDHGSIVLIARYQVICIKPPAPATPLTVPPSPPVSGPLCFPSPSLLLYHLSLWYSPQY